MNLWQQISLGRIRLCCASFVSSSHRAEMFAPRETNIKPEWRNLVGRDLQRPRSPAAMRLKSHLMSSVGMLGGLLWNSNEVESKF